MAVKRICGGCDKVLNVIPGKMFDLTCQTCGSQDGYFEGDRFRQFECSKCLGRFTFPPNKKSTLRCPSCNSKILTYIGPSSVLIVDKKKQIENDSKRIDFWRARGMGDILMTTPLVREIKKAYPDYYLAYYCDANLMPILENNPFIDYVFPINYISPEPPFMSYDLTGKVEDYRTEDGINKKNRLVRFFDLCGMEIRGVGLRPLYFPTKDELSWAGQSLEKGYVALVTSSFAPQRSFNEERLSELANILIANGYKVILLGQRFIRGVSDKVINLANKTSIREFAALISRCAVVVCGDTSAYHIAESLEVPSIVTFGTIPPYARVSTYKFCKALFGQSRCAPCWDLQYMALDCHRPNPDCLKAITDDQILEALKEVIR